MKRVAVGLIFALLLIAGIPRTTADPRGIRNLVLVTLDGVRVEEMFDGMDRDVLARSLPSYQTLETSAVYKRYWADTPEERRRLLMPFFWRVLMRDRGSIIGDRAGRPERLANRHRSSYPGYSEILTGAAHDDIDSNELGQTPYPSVFEVLKRRLGLRSTEVAAFASWSTMHRIVEHRPGTIFVNAGAEPYDDPDPFVSGLSRFQFETPADSDTARRDAYTFEFAMTHLRARHPRVLYIGFDETDELGHAGRYADLLDHLSRIDRWLARLWEILDTDERYRGHTALVVTVDHGRGRRPETWHQHGPDVEGAQDVWTAFVVPGARRRGVWPTGPELRHDRLAATMAQLMGVDYRADVPTAAPPLEEVLGDTFQGLDAHRASVTGDATRTADAR
jgi:hypothetical protein